VKITLAVRPGRRIEKKDRTEQDCQKCHNFTYFGRSPHCTDCNQNLHGGNFPGLIICAKFQNEIFSTRSYDFTGGSNFPVSSAMLTWCLCLVTCVRVHRVHCTASERRWLRRVTYMQHSARWQSGQIRQSHCDVSPAS